MKEIFGEERIVPEAPKPNLDFDWNAIGKKQEKYSEDERSRLEKIYDKTLSSIAEHEVIEGTVVGKNSREIVVKPVGPQISSIPGILGGTIAADGQVMIILDMGPLIRRGLERAVQPPEPVVAVREESRQPVVMVVDDSITMRKVTSRVLENHSLEVMTAQDGVDAIEKLHERVPDLMLLDIEMPRMDGYQLLEHVRADARLRHVPVIMITSRAGQKHRKKARQAGANAYLTKPYQEAELIEQVAAVLDIELVPRRSD